MPVVNEHQISDQNRAGSSRCDQYANRFGKNGKLSRKSEASSPELLWLVPDMFLCLDSLGATVAKDTAPYDRIGYSENSFDRVSVWQDFVYLVQNFLKTLFSFFEQPLSDVSMDVGDGVAYGGGAMMNGSVASNANLLKFHRSMSMGQGWSTGSSLANRYGNQPDENSEIKVVMRRKNNKICDAGKYF